MICKLFFICIPDKLQSFSIVPIYVCNVLTHSWKVTDAIISFSCPQEFGLTACWIFYLWQNCFPQRDSLIWREKIEVSGFVWEYGGCSRVSHCHYAWWSIIWVATWTSTLSCSTLSGCMQKDGHFHCSAGCRWYSRNLMVVPSQTVQSCGSARQSMALWTSYTTFSIMLTLLDSWQSFFGWGESGFHISVGAYTPMPKFYLCLWCAEGMHPLLWDSFHMEVMKWMMFPLLLFRPMWCDLIHLEHAC